MPEGNTRPLKVFICHCSEDSEKALELYEKISAQGWIEPWIDKKNILGGQNWDYEIRKAVLGSDVVLVLNSKVLHAKTGYVQREVRFVVDMANEQPEGAIYVIPLRLDDSDVLTSIAKWQWIDYQKEDNFEKLISSLKHKALELGLETNLISATRSIAEVGADTLPGLTEEDEKLFKLICEADLEKNHIVIQRGDVLELAEAHNITEEEVDISIDMLERGLYIHKVKRFYGTAHMLQITAYGFAHYAQKYIPDFQRLLKDIAIHIDIGERMPGNLAEKLNQPLGLIEHILTLFEDEGYLKVFNRNNGSQILSVSRSIKRFIGMMEQ
jgi:hypothetical protein